MQYRRADMIDGLKDWWVSMTYDAVARAMETEALALTILFKKPPKNRRKPKYEEFQMGLAVGEKVRL